MSIWIDGHRVESIGPTEPLSKEDLLGFIEDMKKAFDSPEPTFNRFVFINDWIMVNHDAEDLEWYKGSGLYELPCVGLPIFINDGMVPETVEFTVFDEAGTFNPPVLKDEVQQSGKDKSDFFNKRKRSKK